MNNTHRLNAAIYVHFFLRDQEQSLQKQMNACWNFCNKRGWKVRYVFIEGCRSETSKSDFHDIVEKAKEQSLDIVVFCKFDHSDLPKKYHVSLLRIRLLRSETKMISSTYGHSLRK
jgi:DNA invertase Pin-like site-specific DNA recombinase